MEDFFNAYIQTPKSSKKLNINNLNGFIGKPYVESKYLIKKYLDNNNLEKYKIVGFGKGEALTCDYNIFRIVIHHENDIVKKITIG